MERIFSDKRLLDATLGDLVGLLDFLDQRYMLKGKSSQEHRQVISEFISLKACAELTGYKEAYIRQLVFKKTIPYYKTKGLKPLRFKHSEIIAWMTERKFTPTEERADEYLQTKKY